MEKRVNKRGQDLSIGTLILIVLGIIVLVLLILGFSMGWSNLWEKINIFQGGNSLSTVAAACNTAVASSDKISYCTDFKKIKVNGKTEYVNCEDDRVLVGVETKLDCGESKEVRESERCQKFDDKDKEKTIVNSRSCTDILEFKEP